MEDLTFIQTKVGTLDNAIELANKGYWHISITHSAQNDMWYVYGGEILIFKAQQRAMVDVFLYGMGFAITAMPEGGFEILKETIE
ncbi:MAG: hypothetical protein SH821_07130 [Phototrophicales bacterium]|nr:hypothetical protein [Phototrophicales bacterium]